MRAVLSRPALQGEYALMTDARGQLQQGMYLPPGQQHHPPSAPVAMFPQGAFAMASAVPPQFQQRYMVPSQVSCLVWLLTLEHGIWHLAAFGRAQASSDKLGLQFAASHACCCIQAAVQLLVQLHLDVGLVCHSGRPHRLRAESVAQASRLGLICCSSAAASMPTHPQPSMKALTASSGRG